MSSLKVYGHQTDLVLPRRQRRPVVFLGSSFEDLKDARGAVLNLLRRFGVRVYAFEGRDFPRASDASVVQHCLGLVRASDVVIGVVGFRYGTVCETSGGTEISITRKEIRIAREVGKPIWCYVRHELENERAKFRQWVAASRIRNPSRSERLGLFKHFKQAGQAQAESLSVYELMDEVERFGVDPVRFFTSDDLMSEVENRLSRHIVLNLHHAVPFPEPADVPRSTIFQLSEYASRSRRYQEENAEAHFLYERLTRGWNPGRLLDFQEALERISRSFFGDYANLLHGSEMVRNRYSRLLITDTTMEYLNPETWRTNKYHRQLLSASSRLARRFNLRFCHYKRVLLLRDPLAAVQDAEWLDSLKFLVDFHQARRMGLGVCRRHDLPVPDDDTFLNFYLIPGFAAGLWCPEAAMAFSMTRESEPAILRHYTQVFEIIEEVCAGGKAGFWIEPGMRIRDVGVRIREIFRDSEPEQRMPAQERLPDLDLT